MLDPNDLAADQIRENIIREAGRKVTQGGRGTNFDGLGNAFGMVVDVVDVASSATEIGGTVLETVASSAEVCGHGVAGACEALGSAGDLLGTLDGCSGCSAAIAFLIVLATAGSALAVTWF